MNEIDTYTSIIGKSHELEMLLEVRITDDVRKQFVPETQSIDNALTSSQVRNLSNMTTKCNRLFLTINNLN